MTNPIAFFVFVGRAPTPARDAPVPPPFPYIANEPNFRSVPVRSNQHVRKHLPKFQRPKKIGFVWVRFRPKLALELALSPSQYK
jgi:hypothetical protein